MKKLLVVLLSTLMLLTLIGCGSKEESSEIDVQVVAKELMADEQFKNNSLMDKEKVELKYGCVLTDMEDGVFCLPTDSEKANMFIIVKAKEGKIDDLALEIDMVINQYDHSWTDLVYNAEEAAKVEKRLVKKVGNYYICIISDANNDVYNKIVK